MLSLQNSDLFFMARFTLSSVGLPAGCLSFFTVYLTLDDATLAPVLAIAAWMLIWWITEAVPIAVTALLPLVLFPMTGTATIDVVAANYGNKFVFLFMGGFIIALAMERWMLHRRIALHLVMRIGSNPRRIVLGFMVATALLSMWISNTATTLMMLPIAMSIIRLNESSAAQNRRFALNLLLGIAYAANSGGIATLVGTPPNIAMAGIMDEGFGIDIGFAHWMLLGLPFAACLLSMVYLLMTRILLPLKATEHPEAVVQVKQAYTDLGPLSTAEQRIFTVFIATASLWVFKDFFNDVQTFIRFNDSSIAMLGALSLFVIRSAGSKPLLTWSDTKDLPWGILLLFGGGMALADMLKQSGVIQRVADVFTASPDHGLVVITAGLVLAALFMTELISNLALVLVFVPVVGAIAQGMGLDPLQFAVPVTLAASCAFMLPMATPPNAIVFAGGYIRMGDMMRAGVVLNLAAAALAIGFSRFFLPWWLAFVSP